MDNSLPEDNLLTSEGQQRQSSRVGTSSVYDMEFQ